MCHIDSGWKYWVIYPTLFTDEIINSLFKLEILPDHSNPDIPTPPTPTHSCTLTTIVHTLHVYK